jgi:hypothetical protein
MPTPDFIEQSKQKLLDKCREEQEHAERTNFKLPVTMDLITLLSLVVNVHLALRHPKNTGPGSQIARQIINQIIKRVKDEGFPANAELMRLGGDPQYDEAA